MITFFNPEPVVGATVPQSAPFATVSFSNPGAVQQTTQPTSQAPVTSVSFFNPAPVVGATVQQSAPFAAVSFSNPGAVQQTTQPTSQTPVTSVSFFNPAPVVGATVQQSAPFAAVSFSNAGAVQQTAQPTLQAPVTSVSFFNPAQGQQPTPATTSTSTAAVSFFNPEPPLSRQSPGQGSAVAGAVSFANGPSPGSGGAGGTGAAVGGTVAVTTFAAGPTVTDVSPRQLSRSAPTTQVLVLTGGNLDGATSVTFTDETGIVEGAISVSADGRSLSIPILLTPSAPDAVLTVFVTTPNGSSPITAATVVTIVP